jgi:sterol 3beta-glucosyltransferase
MHIALLTHGSRGDVQPYVALASALQAAGFTVTLAAPPNLETFVRRCGIPYARLSGDTQQLLDSDEGKRWLSAGNLLAFFKALGAITDSLREDLDRDVRAACAGAEAIIAHPLTQDRALIMAEALGVPLLLGYLFPFSRTGDFPHPLVTHRRSPLASVNRLTYAMFEYAWTRGQQQALADFRQQAGLPPTALSTTQRLQGLTPLYLNGFSDAVVPRPADWPAEHAVTGYWRFDEDLRQRLGEAEPPEGLAEWLAAGSAPIFIGFGSMPVLDPAAMLTTTVALAKQMPCRIIVGAGWSRFSAEQLPEDVRLVGAVNHDWLFPQCRAVVHHGGAGTTAASLRAGKPILICSVFADQPFWGRQLTDLGVGAHLPFKHLSPKALERALRSLLRPEVAARAEALGARLRAENGVDRAVLAIKQHLTIP